ncbi:MAG: YbaK/EbsC family protein [Roseburia hominis]
MEDQIREFPVSSATVELAAEALHTEAGRIAKTLSFLVDGGGADRVTPESAGSNNVKNSQKAFFHAKAKMLAPDEVEERIGHAIGGVCPFGIKEGVRVSGPELLKNWRRFFQRCGNITSAV